jgi:hypothetical protein
MYSIHCTHTLYSIHYTQYTILNTLAASAFKGGASRDACMRAAAEAAANVGARDEAAAKAAVVSVASIITGAGVAAAASVAMMAVSEFTEENALDKPTEEQVDSGHSLYTHYTLTMHSLHTHYAGSRGSRTHYTLHPLCTVLYAYCTHYAVLILYCTHTLLYSLCCTHTVLTILYSYCTPTALNMYYR